MPDAIALGELLIDFVSIEKDVALADLPSFAGAAGGAPANVAVGLAKLGVSAGFVGKVGDDPFGEHLRRVLEEQGVDTSGLRTARNVRTTLAFVATRSDGRKDICFYRHPGADMLLTGEEVSSDLLRSARLFHFGSVALSRSPAREATMHAAEAAREAGLLISYDPNWRPTLWEEPVAARGQIWVPMSLADVLHCSDEEWEFITGGSDLEAGAARILATGPDLVVVTRGDQGCYYDDGASRGEVPGFAVEVVDPLGAGDAFVAAMLSQLMEEPRPLRLSDGRLREVMTFANAAGALACTRRGVIPALPTREEIAAFLAARSA
jgi:fructokinase